MGIKVEVFKEIGKELKKFLFFRPTALATVDEKCNPNVSFVAFIKVISKKELLITDNFLRKYC